MKLDDFYKFISSTFGLAYFVGLIVGLIYFFLGNVTVQQINYTNLFFMTNAVNFKSLFIEIFANCVNLAAIPFSYLIVSVQFGFNHVYLLTSPFLGQIKLLVQLIPQLFYFIAYIISSTIGLKIIIFLITKIVNYINSKLKRNVYVNINPFSRIDNFLIYIALISITIGALIQIYLTKIFFIFLINFQLITYIFIILVYLILIGLSLYVIYQTIISLLKTFENLGKKIISK